MRASTGPWLPRFATLSVSTGVCVLRKWPLVAGKLATPKRLMRVWVGYGPKCCANIVRFQATLHGMEDLHGHTAAALASNNGSFDQAHLTLDVARFAGATPPRPGSAAVADFSKTRCVDFL
jgi:hypothetical protein